MNISFEFKATESLLHDPANLVIEFETFTITIRKSDLIDKGELRFTGEMRIDSKLITNVRGRTTIRKEREYVCEISPSSSEKLNRDKIPFKYDDTIKIVITNLLEGDGSYTFDNIFVYVNTDKYKLIPTTLFGWQTHINFAPSRAVMASPVPAHAMPVGGAGAASPVPAYASASSTFEPNYLKSRYGTCIIECPRCGRKSGTDWSALIHDYDCPNKGKTPNISNKIAECNRLEATVGGYRKKMKRKSRNNRKKNRKTRRR
jgi:hypothetical protein